MPLPKEKCATVSVTTAPISAPITEPPVSSLPPWLDSWYEQLQPTSLTAMVPEPATAAVFAIDMVIGFCRAGKLATARLAALVEPVVELFQRAHALGVPEFLLLQDRHDAHDLEFAAYPTHCRRGSWQVDTVPELRRLPFAERFTVVPKNSIHPMIGTGLSRWLAEHPNLRTAVVAGAGTDLGVYHTAMHLRLRANALNLREFEVIVPADAVAAHHRSVQGARMDGALPHPDEFFHRVYLYHLALNGVRVVRSLAAEEEVR